MDGRLLYEHSFAVRKPKNVKCKMYVQPFNLLNTTYIQLTLTSRQYPSHTPGTLSNIHPYYTINSKLQETTEIPFI